MARFAGRVGASQTLIGYTANWQYYAYGGAYNNNFGGGTSSGSFTAPCVACGQFDNYFIIDTTANTLTFDYSIASPTTWSASALSLSPDIYNGIDFLFSGPISSVSIDPVTNMVGFNSSRIYFAGNEIQVDWQNLPFDSTTNVTSRCQCKYT